MTRKLIILVSFSMAAFAMSAPNAFADSPISPALQHSPAHEQLSTFMNASGRSVAVALARPGQPEDDSTSLVASEPTAAGFDWGAAAVGASSAAMIALLVGGAVVLVRHARGRELAR